MRYVHTNNRAGLEKAVSVLSESPQLQAAAGGAEGFERLTIKSQVPKRKIFMNCSNAFQA